MRRIVFLSAFQSFVSRNILNTGVLDELVRNGSRVVIFTHPSKLDFYKATYESEDVCIEAFDPKKFEDSKERIIRLFSLLLISTNVMRYRKIKLMQKGGSYLKFVFQILFTEIFGRSDLIKRFFRWIDLYYNKQDAFGEFIRKYRPDAVFATDSFGFGDILLLKSALRHNVKSVGMVASWDNNTTKGLMRVVPDILLVQNNIIRDESLQIQAVPDKIIRVVGIAHYDYYMNYVPSSRKDFFKRLGIDPSKRLIVFSPAGDKFIKTDWQICEMLKRAYSEGQIPSDVVILIRIHPSNPVDLRNFNSDENFIVERPGVYFEGLGDKKNELDDDALKHLLNTLNHCELVINVVSSLVIDAAVLDRPIITIGFEGWEKKVPFGSSVKRYHKDENMAKLLAINGTRVAKDRESLIELINFYLKNPGADKEERRELVEKQCWKLDGKAKVRIADAIMN